VHEVEVEVVGAEILQGGIKRLLDVIGVVGVLKMWVQSQRMHLKYV
jgi:hypothetical protein